MAARACRARLLCGLLAATLVVASARSGDRPPLTVAPDFTRTDLSGSTRQLSRYQGRTVLLSFWATWCEPCLTELPVYADWQRRYGPAGLQVIAVSLDEDAGPVRVASERYGVNFPIVMGDGRLYDLYGGVLGLPLTYLIDPAGRIVARLQGETDLRQLESVVQGLLRASAR